MADVRGRSCASASGCSNESPIAAFFFDCPIHTGTKMINTQTERRRRSAAKDLSDTLSEAQDMLGRAAAETGARASDIRSQVAAKLSAAKSKLQDLQDDAINRAKAAAQVTDEYVRDNPWQAIGVSAAVGFLVGVLVSRR
jgi:ElaB/YqjD/DUF883 family membrane-anchored ribosome-binding protein